MSSAMKNSQTCLRWLPALFVAVLSPAGFGSSALSALREPSARHPSPLKTRHIAIDSASLGRETAKLVEDHGNDVRVSLWLGSNSGAAWFETRAAPTLP